MNIIKIIKQMARIMEQFMNVKYSIWVELLLTLLLQPEAGEVDSTVFNSKPIEEKQSRFISCPFWH